MKRKKIGALALLLLILCNYTVHTFASDSIPDISNGPVETELVDENNDVPDIAEAPEGWDGTTEADFNKDDAIPVQGLDEPSEIIPYATSSGTWIQASDGRWWYRYDDGTYPSNGWAYINGYWYYFDADGWMLTGWLTVGGKTYYLGTNGAMAIGWRQIGSYWYYFWSGGSMATGWQYLAYSDGNAWFYFYSSGRMADSNFTESTTNSSGSTTTRTFHINSNGVWLYTTSVISWNRYDSTKHIDYTVDSAYESYVNIAVGKWNAYKSGVLRNSSSGIDVWIYDIYDPGSGTAGVASSSGTLELNTAYLDDYGYNMRLNTVMHELGHMLGLGHNDSGDVMYKNVTSNITLTTNDKYSYDLAYSQG